MKIAVLGARDLTNKDWVEHTVDRFIEMMKGTYGKELQLTFLFGGAKGASSLAREYIEDKYPEYDTLMYKPWHLVDSKMEFHERLFFMRNKQIIDNSDKVLLMKGAKDTDSEVASSQRYAEKRGKDVLELNFDYDEATEVA